MFSITDRPLARSKSAGCFVTIFTPPFASTSVSKPAPRSFAADEPGMPCSSTTLPLPPSLSTRKSAAILPPALLSEAMCELTSAPFTLRSSEITLMPLSVASFTTLATADESVGLIRITLTFFWIRSSTLACCLAGSFCASTVMRVTPSFFASSSAPLRSETKNGLLSVEIDRPTVTAPPAAGADASLAPAAAVVSGPCFEQAAMPTTSNAANNGEIIFFIVVLLSPSGKLR